MCRVEQVLKRIKWIHVSCAHCLQPSPPEFPTSLSALRLAYVDHKGLLGPLASGWEDGKPQWETGRRWKREVWVLILPLLPFQVASGHTCPSTEGHNFSLHSALLGPWNAPLSSPHWPRVAAVSPATSTQLQALGHCLLLSCFPESCPTPLSSVSL